MCTIGILYRVNAEHPVVIAANRDEFYARTARPPEVLDARAGSVGGVDVIAGGTWLGITRRGRIVAVTNQRVATPVAPGLRSRGHAVRAALAADDLDGYVRGLDPREYSSMNLLYGDANEMHVAYFRREAGTLEIDRLDNGVHVLCNDRLGAPGFPRAERLAAVLRGSMTAPWPVLSARVAAALGDNARSPESSVATAGDAHPLAAALTALCIHSPVYGTVSSAVVALGTETVHHYFHAEGSPCVAPFVDYTQLVS